MVGMEVEEGLEEGLEPRDGGKSEGEWRVEWWPCGDTRLGLY